MAFEINIATWNAQGGIAVNQAKKDVVNYFSLNLPNSVILIQEGGTENTGINRNDVYSNHICILSQEDPMSKIKGKRCTVNLLTPNGWDLSGSILDLTTNTRPACYTKVPCGLSEELIIATIHATASRSSSVAEVKSTLIQLSKMSPYWFLAGDFNSEPNEYYPQNPRQQNLGGWISEVTYAGTKSRGEICYLINSGEKTQGPGGVRDSELDFAFASIDLISELASVSSRSLPGAPSDHDPVIFNLIKA